MHPADRDPRRGARRGNALVVVVVVCAIALLLILTTLTESRASAQHAGLSTRLSQVTYAAEAGLQYVCQQIADPKNAYPAQSAAYSGSTNLWLADAAIKPPTTGEWRPLFTSRASPTLVIRGGGRIHDIPVYCWLRDTGSPGNDFEIASCAEMPRGSIGSNAPPEERIVLTMDLRESVGFSSFMFFSFNDNLLLGPVNVNGSIHSNKKIAFPAGAGNNTYVYGNATSSQGFTNTNQGIVTGSKIGNAPQIGLPTGAGNDVASRATLAAGSANPTGAVNAPGTPPVSGSAFYNAKRGSGGGTVWQSLTSSAKPNVNLDITIDNTVSPPTMTVVGQASDATFAASGPTYTYTNVPLPPNGVFYADGPVKVRSIDGTFTGDLSLVSGKSTVTVDSNLRYKDASGNFANVLKDAAGTVVPSPDPNANWGPGAGNLDYRYAPNPAYSTSPVNKLGLMAKGDILVADQPAGATDGNLFLDINTYSEGGRSFDAFALNAAGTPKKNLCLSGSLVGYLTGRRAGQAVAGGPLQGYALTALYGFDNNTASSPPAGWLASGAAAFGAIHRIGGQKAPAKYLDGSGTLYSGYGGAN